MNFKKYPQVSYPEVNVNKKTQTMEAVGICIIYA